MKHLALADIFISGPGFSVDLLVIRFVWTGIKDPFVGWGTKAEGKRRLCDGGEGEQSWDRLFPFPSLDGFLTK